jgi:hypothetical protein
MVFGPPQHRPLGWLTAPRMRTFYKGPLRVGFDFTSGPIPNNAISRFQTARSGLYAERRRLKRAFLPGPKGQGFTRAYR